jgi:hypothetical protein
VRLLDGLLEPVSELHGARLSPARSEATRARGFLCRLRIANGEYVAKKRIFTPGQNIQSEEKPEAHVTRT